MRTMLECFVKGTSQGREVSDESQPLCRVRDMAKDSRTGVLGARPH